MKTIILAGGMGTRLSEETDVRPKPMVDIGGRPILWHIMKLYSYYGFNDFIILLGYKGVIIKEYFVNYFLHQSNITVDLENGDVVVHKTASEKWRVTLIDTGLVNMTGSRIKQAQPYIDEKPFLLTYGDGVGDVDITACVNFHRSHGKLLTMTTSQTSGRFGVLDLDSEGHVLSFKEKPKDDGSWVNAGFFVCEPGVMDVIPDSPDAIFEKEPLSDLANAGEIVAHKHLGFWMPMDNLRDKNRLNDMTIAGDAPWMIWEQ